MSKTPCHCCQLSTGLSNVISGGCRFTVNLTSVATCLTLTLRTNHHQNPTNPIVVAPDVIRAFSTRTNYNWNATQPTRTTVGDANPPMVASLQQHRTHRSHCANVNSTLRKQLSARFVTKQLTTMQIVGLGTIQGSISCCAVAMVNSQGRTRRFHRKLMIASSSRF